MEIGRRFWARDWSWERPKGSKTLVQTREQKRRTNARAIWISPYQRCILPEHLASTVPAIQTGLNGPMGQISEHSAVTKPRQERRR